MALTPYYGLNTFGGSEPGDITDDGAKYTGRDRLAIDRMLHALASSSRHRHQTATLADPSTPTLTLATDGGLPGGATFAYCVTWIDQDGLESLPSPEVVITTPAVLTAPDEPQVDEDAGVLVAGLYFYALTAVRGEEESPLGTQTSISLPEDGLGVLLTLPAPPEGADLIQVWRMNAQDVGWTRISQITATEGGTFLDDGSVAANTNTDDPAQTPPSDNLGVAIYSVRIDLEPLDAAIVTSGGVLAWRIYRTESPSAYPEDSLLHHVVDRDDPTDSGNPALPLLTSWVDEGDILTNGVPPLASASMRVLPYVFDTATELPPTGDYPEYYPLVVDGVLYVQTAGSWVPTTPAPDPTFAEVDPLPDPASYATGYPLMYLGRLYVQVGGVWTLVGPQSPPSFVTSTKFGVD